MIVKLLTEHHLEFLSLIGGCGGSSESTLVKMSNCWKSQSTAQLLYSFFEDQFCFSKTVVFQYTCNSLTIQPFEIIFDIVSLVTRIRRLNKMKSDSKRRFTDAYYIIKDFVLLLGFARGTRCQMFFALCIADFIGLPYFSGFPSGLKSHELISHDFLS